MMDIELYKWDFLFLVIIVVKKSLVGGYQVDHTPYLHQVLYNFVPMLRDLKVFYVI